MFASTGIHSGQSKAYTQLCFKEERCPKAEQVLFIDKQIAPVGHVNLPKHSIIIGLTEGSVWDKERDSYSLNTAHTVSRLTVKILAQSVTVHIVLIILTTDKCF